MLGSLQHHALRSSNHSLLRCAYCCSLASPAPPAAAAAAATATPWRRGLKCKEGPARLSTLRVAAAAQGLQQSQQQQQQQRQRCLLQRDMSCPAFEARSRRSFSTAADPLAAAAAEAAKLLEMTAAAVPPEGPAAAAAAAHAVWGPAAAEAGVLLPFLLQLAAAAAAPGVQQQSQQQRQAIEDFNSLQPLQRWQLLAAAPLCRVLLPCSLLLQQQSLLQQQQQQGSLEAHALSKYLRCAALAVSLSHLPATAAAGAAATGAAAAQAAAATATAKSLCDFVKTLLSRSPGAAPFSGSCSAAVALLVAATAAAKPAPVHATADATAADQGAFAAAVSLVSELGSICSNDELSLSFDDLLLLRVALELLSSSSNNSSNSNSSSKSVVCEGSNDLWLEQLPGIHAAAASLFRCLVLHPHVALPLPPPFPPPQLQQDEDTDLDSLLQQQQHQREQQQEMFDTVPRHVSPFVWRDRVALRRELLTTSSPTFINSPALLPSEHWRRLCASRRGWSLTQTGGEETDGETFEDKASRR